MLTGLPMEIEVRMDAQFSAPLGVVDAPTEKPWIGLKVWNSSEVLEEPAYLRTGRKVHDVTRTRRQCGRIFQPNLTLLLLHLA